MTNTQTRTLAEWREQNLAFCELAAFDGNYYRMTPGGQADVYARFVRETGRKPGTR